MDCTIANKKLIPLHKVISAALVDQWEDVGKMEQVYSHWAARGLKKLIREDKLHEPKKVFLQVNPNTHTATLPPDFDIEIAVAIIDSNWQKVPLKANNKLADSPNIENIPCINACPSCGQDKSICTDLAITEHTNTVIIGSTPYSQTITKKLYPNGDYYLETITPVLNIQTGFIDYNRVKEFITALSLLPCGCQATTPANISMLQEFCPDVYCSYYSGWNCSGNIDYGSYRVFENSGLIQFNKHYKFSMVYMEYWGFMTKINGQYMVPEVAFETLVEYTKFKSVDGKRSVSNPDKEYRLSRYKTERDNMEIVIGRFGLSQIMQAIDMLPKFDFEITRHGGYSFGDPGNPYSSLVPVAGASPSAPDIDISFVDRSQVYVFTNQISFSYTHGLGRIVSYTIYDPAGNPLVGTVNDEPTNHNSITVSFETPTSGSILIQ